MKNIAVLQYHSRHGVDTILFLTDKETVDQLPPITKRLLKKGGVFDPEDRDDEFGEWAEPAIRPIEQLPTI